MNLSKYRTYTIALAALLVALAAFSIGAWRQPTAVGQMYDGLKWLLPSVVTAVAGRAGLTAVAGRAGLESHSDEPVSKA